MIHSFKSNSSESTKEIRESSA